MEILYQKGIYDITLTSNSFSGNGLARAAKYPVKIIPANILDNESLDNAMNQIDVVINGAYLKGGNEAIKSSIKGTKNIIEASIRNDIKHFIERIYN